MPMQFWIDHGLTVLGIAAIGGFIVFWYFHLNPDESVSDPSAVPVEVKPGSETFENPAEERELPVDAPAPAPETQAVFDSDKEPGNFADEVSK